MVHNQTFFNSLIRFESQSHLTNKQAEIFFEIENNENVDQIITKDQTITKICWQTKSHSWSCTTCSKCLANQWVHAILCSESNIFAFGKASKQPNLLSGKQAAAGKASSSKILCNESMLYFAATSSLAECKQKRKRRHRCSPLYRSIASRHTKTYEQIWTQFHT